jgi:hypothetical protein
VTVWQYLARRWAVAQKNIALAQKNIALAQKNIALMSRGAEAPLLQDIRSNFQSCAGNDVTAHATSRVVASIHAQKNRTGKTY